MARKDGKTPLDDRDTVLAFLTHADALDQPGFRWMDVLALQRMYVVLAVPRRAFGDPPAEAAAATRRRRRVLLSLFMGEARCHRPAT